jgi:hypothetical protein
MKKVVIAVRVPEPLHRKVKEAADRDGRSMSGQVAWLLDSYFKWEKEYGDRDKMLEQARLLLRLVEEHALRLRAESGK